MLFVLMIIGQLAGVAILAGVFILLFKRIVILDAETRKPTSFEFPVLGTITTQTPLVIPILAGVGLILVPIIQSERLQVPSRRLKGTFAGKVDQPRVLIVPTIPQSYGQDHFVAEVPLIRDMYDVVVLDRKYEIGRLPINRSDSWDKITIEVQPPPDSASSAPPIPVPPEPAGKAPFDKAVKPSSKSGKSASPPGKPTFVVPALKEPAQ